MLGRSRDRDRGRGFGTFDPSQLEQVLALSPTVLYWRAENAGTVGIDGSGGTATGTDPVGRILDLSGNNNHASAPADGNRATLNATGWVFNGSSSYYTPASAISIATNMTVVRAFKRASAGITTTGFGNITTSNPRDFNWDSANGITQALGSSNYVVGSGNTSTGSFVSTARRGAATEISRLNGTQIATRSVASVSGSFDAFGRRLTTYNNGEISFEAVFLAELSGPELALVEQIAAATNGATLS